MTDGQPKPAATASTRDRRWRAVLTTSLGLIVAAALLRSMLVLTPMPMWESDPLTMHEPMGRGAHSEWLLARVFGASLLGVGPAATILMDVVVLLASAVALLAWARLRQRLDTPLLALAAAGSIAPLLHAIWVEGGSVENARVAASWLAAVWAAVAIAHGARQRSLRGLCAGALLGFVVMLALKGAAQYFVEHPATVAAFEADREAFLRARGWENDSPLARGYERRLRQAEATGWFGLSNVYASFAAAGLAALAGWGVLAWQRARAERRAARPRHTNEPRRFDPTLAAFALATLVAAAALLLSVSRGGMAAGALGVGLALLLLSPPRGVRRLVEWASPRAGVVALLLVVAALLAVVSQGLLGPALGERSLLFRWYYMIGSARVFAHSPLLGVGPADFQQAYAAFKPRLSPEEVTSPHSVLFDFAATLGLFGLAWAALFLRLVWRAGRSLRVHATPGGALGGSPRLRVYAMGLLVGAPTVAALWLGRATGLPLVLADALGGEGPLPLLAALLVVLLATGAWIALALTIWRLNETSARALVPLAAAALALAVHAQIEMTPVQPASALLFWTLLGLAAAVTGAPTIAAPAGERTGRRSAGSFAALAPAVCALAIALIAWPPVARWQSHLTAAASIIEPAGRAETELRVARTLPEGPAATVEHVRREVAEALGTEPAASPAEMRRQLDTLALILGEQAAEQLAAAQDALGKPDVGTERARARLLRHLAARANAAGEPGRARALLERALAGADALLAAHRSSPKAFSLAGSLEADLAEFAASAADAEPHLERARELWEREADLAPQSPGPPRRLMELALLRQQPDEAARWARRLLELDELLRLDPLRQLTELERRRIQRLAAAAADSGGEKPAPESPASAPPP